MSIALCHLLVGMALGAVGDSLPPLGLWTRHAPLAVSSEQREAAENTLTAWHVAVDPQSRKVVVRPELEGNDWSSLPEFLVPPESQRDQFVSRPSAVPVDDGYIVGTDTGEWGGGAWWADVTGKQTRPLLDGNVIGFAKMADGIVAITGVVMVGSGDGALFLLRRDQRKHWQVRKKLALASAALAFTQEADGSVVVLTVRGMSRLSRGTVKALFSTDLAFFYPNSLVVSDGKYYVGMRYAVAEFAPARDGSVVETWLLPPD